MIDVPISCREFRSEDRNTRREFAEKFIADFVRDVAPPKGMDTCTEWTERIRKQFITMCPGDCELAQRGSSKEYLVDSSWMETGDGKRVLLACECEWASDRYGEHTLWGLVEEDFEKLLAFKAPFKVLIFSTTRASLREGSGPEVDFSAQHARDRLKASLENYWHHLAGETYIFIDFPATGIKNGDGVYDAYIWIASKDREPNVEFVPLANGKLNRPSTIEPLLL
jgi:hypothetical protein